MKSLLTLLLLSLLSSAQLVIELKPEKSQYVAHEDVNLILTITNRAGKQLTLAGEGRNNWLNINVYNQGGDLIPYRHKFPAFKAVIVAAGQTVQRTLTISDFYDLSSFGRYRATAFVAIPKADATVRSKYSQFLVTSGRTLFSQRVGMPNTPNSRKYEVINFNGSEKTEIYVRITNDYTGQVTSCQALSTFTSFRKPQAALDRSNNLNLFYLITPTLYTHVIVTPTGKIAKRNYHRAGAIGEPRLEAFANGDVKVAGTIPFDPTARKKEIDQQRKASDRPNLVF